MVSIPTRGGGAGMYGLGRMDEAPGAAQVDVIVPTEAVPARLFVGVADVTKNF